jgi:hypothetical protein
MVNGAKGIPLLKYVNRWNEAPLPYAGPGEDLTGIMVHCLLRSARQIPVPRLFSLTASAEYNKNPSGKSGVEANASCII